MLSDPAIYGRFMAKVTFEPSCGCWIFTGAGCPGYGHIKINGRMFKAHHLTYEHFKGPIPEGLEPDHTCRLKCCVNPDHMEPVTRKENLFRARQFRSKTNQSRKARKAPIVLHLIERFGSQSNLAKALGVSAAAVSGWKTVPERQLKKLRKLTGLTTEELWPHVFGAQALAELDRKYRDHINIRTPREPIKFPWDEALASP